MSSNSSADRPPQRERFAGPLAIGGLAGVGLLLLVMLYPEKSLLRLLAAPEVQSPAQQRYLEALLQLRQDDIELLMVLVRSYLAAGCVEKASRLVQKPSQRPLPPRLQEALMRLRYEVYRQELEWSVADDPEREAVRRRYADQVVQLQRQGATTADLERYLADARSLGERETVGRLERLLAPAAPVPLPDTVENRAAAALGRGAYREAAAVYFSAIQEEMPLDRHRRYFLAGLRILQSGNLLEEALAAADRHLGRLADDRQSLLFLTRLALAANRPDRAQRYVRRALGIGGPGPSGEGTP